MKKRSKNERIVKIQQHEPTFYRDQLYCPLCEKKLQESPHLCEVFRDNPPVKFLAHMVTHYRHNHIDWWDRCWGRYGDRYCGHWFRDYDEQKKKVNESSKRQIIRLAEPVLRELGIGSHTFEHLENHDPKTIALAVKKLDRPAA